MVTEHMAWLGSAGFGLVWGWLIGNLPGNVRKPMRSISAAIIATAAIIADVLWFSDWIAVGIFLVAALLSFVAHLSWRHSLMEKD